MKNLTKWDWERVKIELSEGKSHANELKQQLNYPITITASSREACHVLMEKLISSYDNALALLNVNADVFNNTNYSLNSVELEDVHDIQKIGETEDKDHKLRVAKKRKRGAKRGEQVRVCSEMGFEGQMNDGYNWRKYGQKVILKATHPRAYYRCTHRHTQGCLATKQVQRADDDPSIFQVLYVGKHTCCCMHDTTTTTTTTKHSIETNKDQDNCPKYYIDDEAPKVEDRDDFPLFPFPPTTDNPEEDLNKIKSFYEEDDYLSASHCPINDFSSFVRSDFAEMISSPTRVGDFEFGDIDTHFLDAYW